MLTLKIGNRASMQTETIAAASQMYAAERDKSYEGASTFPDGVLLQGNRKVARISYNAKVWSLGDMRDLGQVFEHEGPLPHPVQDKPQ